MQVLDAIRSGLGDVKGNFFAYLIALGIISALTMALLQAVKDLTSVRRNYNRRKLRFWLKARADRLKPCCKPSDQLAADAEKELIRLASDGDWNAFYASELSSMCVQFSGAAMLVLDYPSLSPELFKILTINGSLEDTKLLLSTKLTSPMPWVAGQQTSSEVRLVAETRQLVIDTRNRVRHQVAQSISSFQLSTGARWQLALKVWSWIISSVLTFSAGILAKELDPAHIFVLLLAGCISGFLAPIARDLVAALQNLR